MGVFEVEKSRLLLVQLVARKADVHFGAVNERPKQHAGSPTVIIQDRLYLAVIVALYDTSAYDVY